MRTRPDPVLLELFDEAGRNVQRTAALLRDLFAEFPDAAGLAEEIHACEHEGDRISHDILHRLAERGPKRSHMDAADVHALAHALDDVVDFAEEAADQLGRYGVEAPMLQAEEIAARARDRRRRGGRAASASCATACTSARGWWRSTGSRTRPTSSCAARSPSSSHRGSTR